MAMNKQLMQLGGLALAAAMTAPCAMAGSLPNLPATVGSVGTSASAALSGSAAASANASLHAAPLALPSVSAPDSLSSAAAASSQATLPGLDDLSGHTLASSTAGKTSAIRPIRIPGGGSINIPITLPIPGQ